MIPMALSRHHAPVEFADRRRELGLTQAQLAMRAECSRASVALLESGYSPRRSEVLERILLTLGYDVGAPITSEATGGRSDGFAKSDVVASRDARTG